MRGSNRVTDTIRQGVPTVLRDALPAVVSVVDDDEAPAEGDSTTPYLAVNQERMRNHLYRAIKRDDIDIAPEDIQRLHDALHMLTDEELQRFATVARHLETQDRDDRPFLSLTDTERQYFELLETAVNRLEQDATGETDDET